MLECLNIIAFSKVRGQQNGLVVILVGIDTHCPSYD
uniref:Uncharacterized protein n=1 Tax=Anguilla anguilla TaxID=7936 RepID=A0A0E9X949_ANGAN